MLRPIDVATICHEANRALCERYGDFSQKPFRDAGEEIQKSAVDGVLFHLKNPDATPENSHENWLRDKERTGWKYGPVKNTETKEHPCFVPYSELPPEQQAKDYLFRGIVHALAPFVVESVTEEVGEAAGC